MVCDVGAYCFCMASNYNMRTRPAEYIIDSRTLGAIETRVRCIRKAEKFEDLIRLCIEADNEN